jgi:transcriptional regulator with XRE-family HTH domain
MNNVEAAQADRQIGQMIRIWLDLLGLTQVELADRLGISTYALSRRMQGRQPWRAFEVRQAADALGVPQTSLLRDPKAVSVWLRQQS